MEESDLSSKPSPLPPLPRDARGSLEVFNPSSFSARSTSTTSNTAKLPAYSGWQNREDLGGYGYGRLETEEPKIPKSTNYEITPWMALKDTPTVQSQLPKMSPAMTAAGGEVGAAAQRAAEWGLVLKTDVETGKPKGVGVRKSGEEDGKAGTSRRDSGNSVRSSEDESGHGHGHGYVHGKEKGIPRVSEDLKDALSAFQQTFVVSDATKPDFPIMYASAGFFNMTGYLAKEVIGRNCRFLQGADTDPAEIAKIREALEAGTNYCGRILNYKKDGKPFWNLLTIAPIKDETGKILKFIGMQVEVSKHTEGAKDKMVRPNGLPESLIRYDARQKEMAVGSVSELVLAVKQPCGRALSESTNRPLIRKSEDGGDQARYADIGRRNSENIAPARRNSYGSMRPSMQRIIEMPDEVKKPRKSGLLSFMGLTGKGHSNLENSELDLAMDDDLTADSDEERPESFDDKVRKKEMRRGIDLATTLERIEKNFVITDPRLPDNPIIFASDSFLELTEYSREEILGRNCRFLQGPETDPATVRKIREAIDSQTDVTVQLINYTKSGKKFWNLFHLQPMRDQKGEVQYFIGVQLDGSQHVEPLHNCIPESTEKESAKLVKETAENVDEAVRELPDANLRPEDLWINHSKVVLPKPHRKDNSSWRAIEKILQSGEQIGLKHFRPVKPLGSGDTGSVHLVELCGTGELFAMKVMDKSIMLNRNKVHRACAEREILDMLDHPFLPALYASFQTKTHICLVTDYCPGGELFLLLDRQPMKVLKEDAVRLDINRVVNEYVFSKPQSICTLNIKMSASSYSVTCAPSFSLHRLHADAWVCLRTRFLNPGNRTPWGTIHEGIINRDKVFALQNFLMLQIFYAAEVVVALEYLHCQGIIYRDLKPENVLIQSNGHVSLTDFDLSCLTSCNPQLLFPNIPDKKKQRKAQLPPIFVAEPVRASNSFVGTEEYIAPEIITGAGHTSAVDWWALGILLYEMFYGYTPFRGKTRQKTFANILHKDLKFPRSISVSLHGRHLMYQLLHRDLKDRLGSCEGANEVKKHPFFRGVKWALVRCMTPPKLDVPVQAIDEAGMEIKAMDPELKDIQTNVF